MKYTPSHGFKYYFDLVKNDHLHSLYTSETTFTFLESIDESLAASQYQPGKWSIKQVIGHISDHERIKMHRAFLLSRNQKVELWGYDQEVLINNSNYDYMDWNLLVRDLKNLRRSSVSFIETLSDNQLNKRGNAREYRVTLNDFLKSIIGHEQHHLNIIKEKYL